MPVAGAWFLSSRRSSTPSQWRNPAGEAAAELMLVAALAEQRWDRDTKDKLARAMLEQPLLANLDWDWINETAESLQADGPLFSESRNRIASMLSKSSAAPEAVALAARLIQPDTADDASIILADVASKLGVELPSDPKPLSALLRCPWNDPEAVPVRFEEALSQSEGASRRLLLFKLQAARACLGQTGSSATLRNFGYQPQDIELNLDSVIVSVDGTFLCRFLAEGEALFPAEIPRIAKLMDQMELGQRFLLAHEHELSPEDKAAWQSLDPALGLLLGVGPRLR